MPGSGTDKTKRWIVAPGPAIVLVESQLGENIGAAARAMANFGLAQLRLVKPLQGWPNDRARMMASGADTLAAELDSVLGTAWDEALEPYRDGGDTGEVSWLNRGVG